MHLKPIALQEGLAMTLTRRQFLAAGTVLAGSGGLIDAALAQAPLNQVTVPSSGLQLPAIGMGCRNYRGSLRSADMPVFSDTFATFHRLGGRVVDTSPNYGNSEEIIGRIMADQGTRDQLWVATKVDRQNRNAAIERMQDSFELLGGEQFDLMQVHNLRGVEEVLPLLQEWKAAGRFRHIGVTTSSDRQYDALADIMQAYPLDFIQVDYSLGNRNAAERLLPLARDRGMAVLVNLPFGRGRLFNAVGDRALPDWATAIDATSWAQVFLKYVMSHPASPIPIPGTTKPHHAEDNINAARGRLPDTALRREMEAFIDPLLA